MPALVLFHLLAFDMTCPAATMSAMESAATLLTKVGEAALRRWAVSNMAGLTRAFKSVIHDESIMVEGATKAPDNTYRITGSRRPATGSPGDTVNDY